MNTCKHCLCAFPTPSRHPQQKFCSLVCRDSARRKAQIVHCSVCHTAITRQAKRLHQKNFYCSSQCGSRGRSLFGPRGSDHVQSVPKIETKCHECGKVHFRQPSKAKKYPFCSVECRLKWQRESGYSSGENNAAWLGGHSDYRGPNWNAQRKKARRRDGCCVRCGIMFHLQVHHKKPFRSFANYLEANQLDNLETLCSSCHQTEEWTTGSRSQAACSSDTALPALASREAGLS